MIQDELIGTVERFLFKNEENGFAVLILQTKRSEKVTVKGALPGVNAGQHVTLQGSWVIHPKFGKQFDAKSCSATLPTSILGLRKYLGSGLIKGIGPVVSSEK